MDNLKMLPEYLFTVGHSMQDISRNDFSLLNSGDVYTHTLEKDMSPINIYRLQNNSSLSPNAINLPKPSAHEDNYTTQNFVDIKLESINSTDLFTSHSSTCQQNPTDSNHDSNSHQMFPHKCFDHTSTKLLLQGSDDPLISHGANNVLSNDDEHPADFAKTIIVQNENNRHHETSIQKTQVNLRKISGQQLAIHHRPSRSGCSNLTKQQLKVKANLMCAQNKQKQNQDNDPTSNDIIISASTNQKHQSALKSKKKKPNRVKLRFHHQALPPEYLSHYEATQTQQSLCTNQQKAKLSLQRTSSKTVNHSQKQTQPRNSNENVRSWLQKIAEIQKTANASKGKSVQNPQSSQKLQCQSNKTTVITDESHVIRNSLSTGDNTNTRFENNNELHNTQSTNFTEVLDRNCISNVRNNSNRLYDFYTDLPYMGEITLDNCKPRRGRKPKKADICNLIYKNYGTILPKKFKVGYIHPGVCIENGQHKVFKYEQPLNLCLRDQLSFDSYSISSGEELSESNSSCPTPINSLTDCMRDSMLANSLKNSLNDLSDITQEDAVNEQSEKTSTLENVNHLIKPINIYYQNLFESGLLLKNANVALKTIHKDNQIALKIPIPSELLFSQKLHKTFSSPICSITEHPEPPSSTKLESSLTSILSCENQQALAPQKRKRSAIFIPPMNIENTANPTTEVSICKFKFTGGSKPTLQEKKMISVDACGNYRYFSGTGDKASRGFEYFPRESLQLTAGLLPGVNCNRQKIPLDISPPTDNLNNELLHICEPAVLPITISDKTVNNTVTSPLPITAIYDVSKNEKCSNSNMENVSYSSSSTTTLPNSYTFQSKNRTGIHQQIRKPNQREKLEKTFKEQGFLIQTQQLESAEGATYCKFRQLKKFTRYLFRNWKGYLPDDLQQHNIDASALTLSKEFPS